MDSATAMNKLFALHHDNQGKNSSIELEPDAPATFVGCHNFTNATNEGMMTFADCQRIAEFRGYNYFGLKSGNDEKSNYGMCQLEEEQPSYCSFQLFLILQYFSPSTA